LQPADADPGLFVRDKGSPIFLLVYVDDILIVANCPEDVTWATDAMQSAFDARDLGDAHVYLGITIARDRDARKRTLSQQKMTKGLVATYGLADAKPLAVPIYTARKNHHGGEPLDRDQCPYSRLIGSLLYLTNCTRPDIAQAVGVLSKFSSCATTLHWRAALNVLRYLSGTESFGLCFGGGNTQIMGFCDADCRRHRRPALDNRVRLHPQRRGRQLGKPAAAHRRRLND